MTQARLQLIDNLFNPSVKSEPKENPTPSKPDVSKEGLQYNRVIDSDRGFVKL